MAAEPDRLCSDGLIDGLVQVQINFRSLLIEVGKDKGVSSNTLVLVSNEKIGQKK